MTHLILGHMTESTWETSQLFGFGSSISDFERYDPFAWFFSYGHLSLNEVMSRSNGTDLLLELFFIPSEMNKKSFQSQSENKSWMIHLSIKIALRRWTSWASELEETNSGPAKHLHCTEQT